MGAHTHNHLLVNQVALERLAIQGHQRRLHILNQMVAKIVTAVVNQCLSVIHLAIRSQFAIKCIQFMQYAHVNAEEIACSIGSLAVLILGAIVWSKG